MERLNHQNHIEIKLLGNRRFIYANRRQSIVITAEHLATEITVLFPDEYEEYSKRVDFINSRGEEWTEGLYVPEFKEYKPGFHKTRFHFKLPTEVTTEGELKMQFLAYLPDKSMTTVPFEVIPIDVQNGILAFKRSSKSNPDLLIMAANRSNEALFLAQQAKARSTQAETQSAAAVETAQAAKAESAEAVETAQRAEGKIDAAVETAQAAEQSAAQAVSAANTASAKADSAITTANQAKTTADQAALTAATAQDFAQGVVDRANAGEFNGEKGDPGDKGDKGDPGQDGYMFSVDNLIGFYVDEDGGFYAYASETAKIDFRYDEISGNLYVLFT